MEKSSTAIRRAAGHLGIGICVASAFLCPLQLSAATPQEVSAAIRQQTAAKPQDGPAILERNLRRLPEGERVRYASGAYAASLEGVERNSDRVLDLFEAAVSAAPRAVLGLMEVAHGAAPDRIVDITRIAIRQAAPAGRRDYKGVIPPGERDYKGGGDDWEETVAAIVAKAMSLAPNQRAALAALVQQMFPAGLAARILDGAYALVLAPGVPVGGVALGGTINPANVGGSVLAPGVPDEKEDVSPSE